MRADRTAPALLYRDQAREYGARARDLLLRTDDLEDAASCALQAAAALWLMQAVLTLPRTNHSLAELAAFGRAKRVTWRSAA